MAKKVMVVDDSNAIRQSLVFTLKNAGYDAIEASNGAVALDLMKEHSVGLFISDVNMPEMDGFKVLELLKKDYNTISIPVVMLTAVMTDEAKAKSTSLYDEGYIEKPVTAEELEREIEKVMRIRDSAKE